MSRRRWRCACNLSLGGSSPTHSGRHLPAAIQRAVHLRDARDIVDYLSELGISDCYASSYLKAVPGSSHGYDVADPTRLNPEIGTDEDYRGSGSARCARATWATCSTWCRTTWASRSRRTRGGRTCSRTDRARGSRTSSTSSGSRSKDELRRQGADSDSRRSVRRGARAAGAAAGVSATAPSSSATTTTGCRSRPTPSANPRRTISTRWLLEPAARREDGESTSCRASSPRPATCRRAARATPRDSRRARARRRSSSGGSPALARAQPRMSAARRRSVVGASTASRASRASFDLLDALLERAVVPARALARGVRGDQLPALLRRQRAGGAAHGGPGRLRRGRTASCSSWCAAAPRPGCASITSTASTRRATTCAACRRAPPRRLGEHPERPAPFYVVVEKILGPRRAAAARLAGRTARPATNSPPSSTACSSTAATSGRMDDIYERFIRERRERHRSTTSSTAARSR